MSTYQFLIVKVTRSTLAGGRLPSVKIRVLLPFPLQATCINPIIDPQLPQEQAGLVKAINRRPGYSTNTGHWERFWGQRDSWRCPSWSYHRVWYCVAPWVDPETPPDAARYPYGALHCGADLKPQLCAQDQRWIAKQTILWLPSTGE